MNETRDIDVDDRNTSGVILPEESVLLSFSTIREHLETKEGAEDNPLLTQAELISEIATLRGKMFAVTSGEDFTDEHYLQFCKDQIDISAMRDSEPIVETLSEHSLLDTVMKYRQKINAHLFVNALLIMAVRVKEQIDYCIEEGMTTVPSALLRSKTEKGQNPDLYNWILSNEVLRSLSFDWGRLLEIVPVDLPCHGHRVSAEPSGFSQYLEFLDRGNRRGLLSGCIVCLGLDNMSDAVHFLQNSVHTRDIALLGEGQEEEVAEIQGRKNRLKESTQKRLNLDRVSAKIIPSLEEMQTRIETGDQDPIHTFYAGPGALQGRDTREVEHIFELVFQCLAGGGYFAFTIEAPNGGIDGLGVPLIQSESSVDPPEAQQNYEGPLYRIFKRAYLTGGKTFVFRDEIKIRELCKKIPGFEVSEFRTAGGKEEDPHCSGEGEVPFYQVVLRKKEEAPQVGIPKRNPSSIQENVFELQSGREVGIRTLSLEDVDQVLSLYNEVDVDNLEDINLFKKRGGIFSLLTQERLQEMIDSEGKDYITRVATIERDGKSEVVGFCCCRTNVREELFERFQDWPSRYERSYANGKMAEGIDVVVSPQFREKGGLPILLEFEIANSLKALGKDHVILEIYSITGLPDGTTVDISNRASVIFHTKSMLGKHMGHSYQKPVFTKNGRKFLVESNVYGGNVDQTIAGVSQGLGKIVKWD